MSGMSRAVLIFGLISGFAAETLAGDSVPGGWDDQVGSQPFSETRLAAYPAVGPVGAYGYGVIPGSRPVFAKESFPAELLSPASNAMTSLPGTTNILAPLAKTVRRSTSKGRRSGRQ